MPGLDDLRAAMAARLANAGIDTGPAVRPRRDPERAPLSFSQQGVWSHQQENPGSIANNICLTFTYTGVVDAVALERALAAVVQRHEILRTTYHRAETSDGQPYQRIHEHFPPRVVTVDLREADDPEGQFRSIVATAATEVFDLSTQTSIRLSFVQLPPAGGAARLAVVIAMAHIVWDGMTLPAMARDVARFYGQARSAPDGYPVVDSLSPQVADFAEWERDRFSTTDHSADIAFWEQQFRGDVATAVLPYDHRPDNPAETSARIDRTLSAAADAGLRTLASELRIPPFSVFLAAYYLALRELSGRDDLVIGTTVANREEQGAEALIGNFSNTIALRICGTAADTFGDLAARVRAVTNAAFEFRTFPFDQIVQIARRVTEDPHAHPFDSLVLFLDHELTGIELPGATMTWELADKGGVALPLTVETFMHPDRTEVQIGYQVNLLAEPTIIGLHHLIDHYLASVTVSTQPMATPIAAR